MTQDNAPDATNEGRATNSTRRTFLKLGTVATVAAFGFGHVQAQAETFEFEGTTQGWEGPGGTNPTLELEAGQTYEVVWTNGDGLPHEFVILDDSENELESTELISEQGATETLQFEATEEMAEYYCSVHPDTMRGDIQISGDGEMEPTEEEEEEEEEPEEEEEEEEEPEEEEEEEEEPEEEEEEEEEPEEEEEEEEEPEEEEEEEEEPKRDDCPEEEEPEEEPKRDDCPEDDEKEEKDEKDEKDDCP